MILNWVCLPTLHFILVISGGCVRHVTQTSAETYYLTPTEREHLVYLALKKNNAEAAMDLGDYYFISCFDRKSAEKWYETAEKLGHPRAIRMLNGLK
jgi:TPR repeat protein